MRIIEGYNQAKKSLDRRAAQNLVFRQEPAVRKIINNVRRNGDAALYQYALELDGVTLTSLEVGQKEIKAAYRKVDQKLISAMQLAAERISDFHRMQADRILKSYTHGKTGWVVRPLQTVGAYAPGGTAIYPSTVLMTVIPVAGVKDVILTTPPAKNGRIPPATLVAADLAGAARVFAVGGAQAIAAMAFGTTTIPRVDKVAGPGNIWTFLAKKLLYGTVGIDSLQGPSDVAILADTTADPECCAADLLAQSEHGDLSQSVMITPSLALAKKTIKSLQQQLKTLKRQEILQKSLQNNCIIAVVENIDEAIDLINRYAPEHALVLAKPNTGYEERIINAGCIIYGERATVPMSDYISGPSHSLPTEGTARFASPLNVTDFIKITNLSKIGNRLMEVAGNEAIAIARAEGLDAHAVAMELRMKRVY